MFWHVDVAKGAFRGMTRINNYLCRGLGLPVMVGRCHILSRNQFKVASLEIQLLFSGVSSPGRWAGDEACIDWRAKLYKHKYEKLLRDQQICQNTIEIVQHISRLYINP